MLKLAVLVYVFVAPVFAGTLVLGVLVADMALYAATPLIVAFFVGLVAAAPASWLVARAMLARTRRDKTA